MTRQVVQTAIREGIPFEIKMADGQTYTVDDAFRIAVGETTVVLVDRDGDRGHWLPLLTMTGISYLKNGNSAR